LQQQLDLGVGSTTVTDLCFGTMTKKMMPMMMMVLIRVQTKSCCSAIWVWISGWVIERNLLLLQRHWK
jgi:hypothetical protein